MVRIESWRIRYKLKLLDVCLFVAYPGTEITESTKPLDRTEFDILTVTDMAGNFIYDGTSEPHVDIPDDLLNTILFESHLNPPESVLVFSSIPEDDHIDADHEIIVKQTVPENDSESDSYDDYSSDEDDYGFGEEDDDDEDYNRFS